MKKVSWIGRLTRVIDVKGVFGVGLIVSLAAFNGKVAASDIPSDLASAHTAYLEGRNDEAMALLKTSLEQHSNDKVVTDNAFGLLKQIVREGNFSSPPSTKLPAELSKLEFGLRNVQRQSAVNFTIKLKAKLKTASRIKSMKVSYFDGESILDSKAGLGEVEDENEDGAIVTVLSRHGLKSPPKDGPLSIEINFDNGSSWRGWVPLMDLVSSASPKILEPSSQNQVYTTGTPSFRWQDFMSPEYKEDDQRSFWASVSDTRDGNWKDLVVKDSWHDGMSPNMTVPPEKELANGSYVFYLFYGEGRKFGDIRLKRGSVSIRDFSVER